MIDRTQEEMGMNGLIVDSLSSALKRGLSGLDHVPTFIRSMLERQAWRKRYVCSTKQIVEFDSFMEFLAASPPEGLQIKYEDLWQLCDQHPEVQAMLNRVSKGIQGERKALNPTNLTNNIQEVKAPAGTSRAAGLRKLRKYSQDRPDVAEIYAKVLAGEISVNKALVNTGLRRARKSIPVSSVEIIAQKLIEHLTPDELKRLIELIDADLHP